MMASLREIDQEYELHSCRSTAVNEVLVKLQAALRPSPQEWHEALRVNLLSMWLHQVLAFEHALNCLRHHGKDAARQQNKQLSECGQAAKTRARQLWPKRTSARGVYRSLCELGEVFGLASDPQFCHELAVAPRHFIWRDAWAHRGGRLQDFHQETYHYFRECNAVEDRDGSAWPLDPAWQEARLSFQQIVRLLTGR